MNEILDLSLLWPPGITLANHVSLKKRMDRIGSDIHDADTKFLPRLVCAIQREEVFGYLKTHKKLAHLIPLV